MKSRSNPAMEPSEEYIPPPSGKDVVSVNTSKLSQKIETFQHFLSDSHGRCEFTVEGQITGQTNKGGATIRLKFCRKGREWVIKVYHVGNNEAFSADDPEPGWRLLTDAPMWLKIGAVSMFPKFVEAMHSQRAQMAKAALEATNQIDALIEQMSNSNEELGGT